MWLNYQSCTTTLAIFVLANNRGNYGHKVSCLDLFSPFPRPFFFRFVIFPLIRLAYAYKYYNLKLHKNQKLLPS